MLFRRAFLAALAVLFSSGRLYGQRTASKGAIQATADSARKQQHLLASSRTSVSDTALLLSLGEPPVGDSVAFAAWRRLALRLYGGLAAIGDAQYVATRSMGAALMDWRAPYLQGRVDTRLNNTEMSVSWPFTFEMRVMARKLSIRLPEGWQLAGAADASSSVRPYVALDSSTFETILPDLALIAAAGTPAPIAARETQAAFGVHVPDQDDRQGDAFPAMAKELRSVLRGVVPARTVPLVILDSGWPSWREKERSIAFFDALGAKARALFGITADVDDSESGSSHSIRHPHVVRIVESLAPLTASQLKAVDVIYVPLTYEPEDAPVLRRLLLTHRLIAYQNERLRTSPFSVCGSQVAQDSLLACLQASENSLSVIPPSVDSVVSVVIARLTARTPTDVFAGAIGTTTDIYSAVWTLLEAWSHINRSTTAFINASWTMPGVPPHVMSNKAWLDGQVTTVAATGNSGEQLTLSSRGEFVQRPFLNDGSFILVDNQRRDGSAMCRSTTLKASQIRSSSMLAYSFGRVTETDEVCGSSYAAPRVAWILAAAESIRGEVCGAGDEARRRTIAIERARRESEPWRWPIYYLSHVVAQSQDLSNECNE